jgi:hypothetical protein
VELDHHDGEAAASKKQCCQSDVILLGFVEIEGLHGKELCILDNEPGTKLYQMNTNKLSVSNLPMNPVSLEPAPYASPQRLKITQAKIVNKSINTKPGVKKVIVQGKNEIEVGSIEDQNAKDLIKAHAHKKSTPQPRDYIEVSAIDSIKKVSINTHEREESPESIFSTVQGSDRIEQSKMSISARPPSSQQIRNPNLKQDVSSPEDRSTMQDTNLTQKPIVPTVELSEHQFGENGLVDKNLHGTKSRGEKSKWILGSVIDEEESGFEDNLSSKYKESSQSEMRNLSRYKSDTKFGKDELTKAERYKLMRSKGKTASELSGKPSHLQKEIRKPSKPYSSTQGEAGEDSFQNRV